MERSIRAEFRILQEVQFWSGQVGRGAMSEEFGESASFENAMARLDADGWVIVGSGVGEHGLHVLLRREVKT